MIGASDTLPRDPRRVLVAGVTGSGKSTLARRIGAALDIPYTEIDALYHGPGWTRRESFLDEVEDLIAHEEWVTEWQYASVRARLAERADTIVWLDYPVRISLTRLVRRTLRRRRNHEVLWNGNVEPPLWHLFTGRDHIIAWALKTQRKYKSTVPALEASATHLQIVRLRSHADAELWLETLISSRR